MRQWTTNVWWSLCTFQHRYSHRIRLIWSNLQCTTGQVCCDGTCTDLNGDENNCGHCGRVVHYLTLYITCKTWKLIMTQCPPGTNCVQGICTCATPCNGGCVGWCLSCDIWNWSLLILTFGKCSIGQGCCDGACTNLDTVDNCGTCGRAVSINPSRPWRVNFCPDPIY